MDLVFCQGIKISRLFPKTSKFPLRLQSFIYKYPEVTTYRQIQCSGKGNSQNTFSYYYE